MSPFYFHMLVTALISGIMFLLHDIVKAIIDKPWWKSFLATAGVIILVGLILTFFLPENLDHIDGKSVFIGCMFGLLISEAAQFAWKKVRK